MENIFAENSILYLSTCNYNSGMRNDTEAPNLGSKLFQFNICTNITLIHYDQIKQILHKAYLLQYQTNAEAIPGKTGPYL